MFLYEKLHLFSRCSCSDINTVILRDRVKGLNILESLALLGLGSAGDLLKGWVSAVVDLLGLEV